MSFHFTPQNQTSTNSMRDLSPNSSAADPRSENSTSGSHHPSSHSSTKHPQLSPTSPRSPKSRPLRRSSTLEFPDDPKGLSNGFLAPVGSKFRARRESCVVHNLLQPWGDNEDGEIVEVHSSVSTPMQRLAAHKPPNQLDTESLSDLVVSVRDLSKSLSAY